MILDLKFAKGVGTYDDNKKNLYQIITPNTISLDKITQVRMNT